MNAVARGTRAYFLAVMALALVVAGAGLPHPELLPDVLPLALPPLHARVVGALYLGGAVCMALAARARSTQAQRSALELAGLWTGTLLMLTGLRWADFDTGHRGLWAWLAAYVVFPVGALMLLRRLRARRSHGVPGQADALRVRSRTVPRVLAVQGAALLALALALFVQPEAAGALWPWTLPPLLAQLYAGPLSALGLVCMLLARRRHWDGIGIVCVGLSVFCATALLAAARHAALFDPNRARTWAWLGSVALLGVVSASLAWRARRVRQAEQNAPPDAHTQGRRPPLLHGGAR